MAVTLESVQTGVYADTTLTITKPVDTAVGDLLIGVIHGNETGGITIPSGWSTLTTVAVGAATTTLFFYYKIATSTEVAASNFSWVVAGGQYLGGCIARVTGHHSTAPLYVSATDTETTDSTPTYTTTITPATTDSLLFFCVASYLNSSTTRTMSGYAVTTSDPTWTERLDITTNAGGSQTYNIGVATATRTEVTATGDANVTFSGVVTNSGNIMVGIRPQITISQTETESVADTLIKSVGKVLTETESVVDTLTADDQRIWTNQSKSSSSWTNQSKS